jgi:hypothetical protein
MCWFALSMPRAMTTTRSARYDQDDSGSTIDREPPYPHFRPPEPPRFAASLIRIWRDRDAGCMSAPTVRGATCLPRAATQGHLSCHEVRTQLQFVRLINLEGRRCSRSFAWGWQWLWSRCRAQMPLSRSKSRPRRNAPRRAISASRNARGQTVRRYARAGRIPADIGEDRFDDRTV